MEPKYKLTYFNGRGLAEFSRLILAYAKVDYIDERLKPEEWAKRKTFMFMKLPILSIGDVQILESRAIARYLAKEFGLTGKDNIEAAQCDMLVDEFFDIYQELDKWRSEEIKGFTKQINKSEFINPIYCEFLRRFSYTLHLRKRKDNEHHFVGDQVTWADIVLAHGFWELMNIMENHVSKSFYDTPGRRIIIEFVEQILSIPSIKEWIDKRPKTDF